MAFLDIGAEMAALDSKDREFYNNLSDDDKKKFTTFLMIRWGACVTGSEDMQTYYLQSTNLKLNKNYFAVSDTNHKQLNWLTTTTISPGMGNLRHQWLAGPKRATANSKVAKFLAKLHPTMKPVDLKLLESLNDLKAWKKYAEQLGMSKEQIKKELG